MQISPKWGYVKKKSYLCHPWQVMPLEKIFKIGVIQDVISPNGVMLKYDRYTYISIYVNGLSLVSDLSICLQRN